MSHVRASTPATQHETQVRRELRAARRLVADLRRPDPWIYWPDLIATAAVTWSGVAYAGLWARGVAPTAAALLIAGLALSRAVMFLHEAVHMKRGALPGFRAAWDLLIGVPFLVPSFVYARVHLDHHRVAVYRTPGDPEHPPDDRSVRARAVATVLLALAAPAALALRWLLVAPLSWLHPRLRRVVEERASGLTTNPAYRPAPLRGRARAEALALEASSAVWTATLAALTATGWLAPRVVIAGAVVLAIAAALTLLRGEILHQFSTTEPPGTPERQVLDSVSVPHTGVLSGLLLPVGIGYHALHHLDARLPYHAMGAAHRRLMATLPERSAYRRTVRAGVGAAIRGRASADR